MSNKVKHIILSILISIVSIGLVLVMYVIYLDKPYFISLQQEDMELYIDKVQVAVNNKDVDEVNDLFNHIDSTNQIMMDFENVEMNVKSVTIANKDKPLVDIYLTCTNGEESFSYLLVLDNSGSDWKIFVAGVQEDEG